MADLGDLLDANDNQCVAPEPFKVIIGAAIGQEAMNDNIAVVHENPPVFWRALYAPRHDALLLFGLVFDVVDDGLQLTIGGSTEDDEEICDGRHLTHIHDHDVFALDVGSQVCYVPGELYRFQ